MTSKRTRWTAVSTVVVAIVAIAAVLGVAMARSGRGGGTTAAGSAGRVSNASVDYGSAPDYTLTDQNGREVSSRDFAGKVRVVSFLFPYCTTYCPVIGRTLVQLDHELAARHLTGKVEIVAFNVDPGGSGPKQMREFWKQYGGDPASPTFAYLTGDPKQVRHIVYDGFHVYYKKVEGEEEGPQQPNPLATRAHVDYDITHNDSVEVVGPDGRIRKIFDQGDQVSVEALMSAVRAALDQG